MNPYLNQLRKTRRAYERASRTIDRMRAELRTALADNAEALAPVAEARDDLDDLFSPQIPLEHLETLFCGGGE
jgi:hypothetical protein